MVKKQYYKQYIILIFRQNHSRHKYYMCSILNCISTMQVPVKSKDVKTISTDLKQLEAEWKEKDPDMLDLKGYGIFVQERVQQAEGIELPAA